MNKIEKNKTLYQLLSDSLIIPDYQRDYAQGRGNDLKIEDTRKNFVSDIITAAENNRPTHIGLVFGSNNNGLEGFVAVDGQQRLTTCFLFHLYVSKRLSGKANPDLANRLHNFGWHGRIYASEFTEFLFDTNSFINIDKNKSLSQIFRQSSEYFSIWEKDPTVNNILVMLDEIHCWMKNLDESSLKNIEQNLISESCMLNFDYMKLEAGTDEFQYQKMNSRGRDLTTYELFKQKFISENSVSENIKEKMDNQWLIFFDKLANENGYEADIFFQNYINETALWMGVKYTGESYSYISQIENSKLQKNRTDIAFVCFDAYKEFCKHIAEAEHITDWLISNIAIVNNCVELFRYTEENTKFIDIFTSADYQARAVNYAICHYAIATNFENIDEENFKLWWRPLHNLIANSDIRKENFFNIIKSIDQIPSTGIYEYLRNSEITGFNEYQREEERKKAIMCIDEPTMTELFAIQEKRKRFHGQIGMLLPDANMVTPNDWKVIIETYESLAGERYIQKDTSDFDFITAMITFVSEEDIINELRLKYETGHLQGRRIQARCIHQMIFKYIENQKNNKSLSPQAFFDKCRMEWSDKYSKESYERKRQFAWIKFILDHQEECKELFSASDYGKIAKKDNNLWLYLKTNRKEQDILLSNKRNAVIDRLFGLSNVSINKHYIHHITAHYPEYPYLDIVFAPHYIWIGIPTESKIEVPNPLPKNIWATDSYKAWVNFKDINNFYEHDGESFDQYVENLSIELKEFCDTFVKDLIITKPEE